MLETESRCKSNRTLNHLRKRSMKPVVSLCEPSPRSEEESPVFIVTPFRWGQEDTGDPDACLRFGTQEKVQDCFRVTELFIS